MSRQRGTLPVRIARHRVVAFTRWLSSLEIPERSILGDAGITKTEIEARDIRYQMALDALRVALADKTRGRPRGLVATYYLPVAGLLLLDDWKAALTAPRQLRPLIWQIHGQLRSKHRQLPPDLRRKNIANGFYSPETVRKYLRELKQSRAPKGKGLFAFKPDDKTGRRAVLLNPVPLMILPQFFQK